MVTRISSAGKWVPLHADQYDGEVPVVDEDDRPVPDAHSLIASGTVVLKGNALPWNAGSYELRYHHDGKHNVMARLAPLEIFVPRPTDPMSLSSVQDILTRIVTLALDSDSSLVPQSAIATPVYAQTPRVQTGSVSPAVQPRSLLPPGAIADQSTSSQVGSQAGSALAASFGSPATSLDGPDRIQRALSTISTASSQALSTDDPDDFTIMSTTQAERMVKGIRLAFDVEFTPSVIVAQPNVRELAERIVGSLKILAKDDPDNLRARAFSTGSLSGASGGGIAASP